jgi:hypothetical protein
MTETLNRSSGVPADPSSDDANRRLSFTLRVAAVWSTSDDLPSAEDSQLGYWRRAPLKLLQLRVARRLGFRGPDSLVTNDSEQARSFLAAHPDGVITKGLMMPMILLE